MTVERVVEFASQGATLRGRLFLPAAAARRPAILVMAHGFSATADGMVADQYARVFRDAGLAVLLYDHRNFGRSGGEPRQQIDNWLQVLGYRDAIDFVRTLDDVDAERVAVWGDSKSGGCVLVAGAFDDRIAAIVTQVPACGDIPPLDDPGDALLDRVAGTYATALIGPADAVEGPMPVVAADQLATPSALAPLTAFRWFIEYGGRYGTGWQNWVTGVDRQHSDPYQPALCARRVRVPTMFVIAIDDEMPGASSDVARLAFESVRGPKELLEIEGGHFGLLYHPGALFDLASRAESDFLLRHLGGAD